MRAALKHRAKAFLTKRLGEAAPVAQPSPPKGLLFEVDEFYQRTYQRGLQVTNTPDNPKRRERHYNLMQFFQQTIPLPDGLMAECGCWNGLSSFVMCNYVRARQPNFTGAGYHIFDSFEGLSEPTAKDALPAQTIANLQAAFGTVAGGFRARLEDVRAALSDFPEITFHPGWLPASLEGLPEARYKFVHIDVDLYEPTLGAVAYFYPRLVPGGLIICDDYGSLQFPGARRAFDEYCSTHNLPLLTISTAQAVLWKR
ncbi:MAG TPA: TylF/MycF/NovP-related O-methyltransferase [Chthoniobacterales bacterium]|nr:TylF/MycF/NovP-related O-methyltransferase [Chthoniobacterales bacterium]